MATCKNCGSVTQLNFPLCRNCWKGEKAQTDQASAPGGAEPAAGPRGSPLDIPCLYQWSFGPKDGMYCGSKAGEPCLMPEYAPYIDVRMVRRGEVKELVHEARYQAWKAQPVRIYEGME